MTPAEIAAKRRDSQMHSPTRPHVYCPSCVDSVVSLADELDARNGEIRCLKRRVQILEMGLVTARTDLHELSRVYGDQS